MPTPIIHHRSVLGANRPNSNHLSLTKTYSLTHLVRPTTPMSQKPFTGKISNTMPAPPDLTWADQAKPPQPLNSSLMEKTIYSIPSLFTKIYDYNIYSCN